MRHTIITIGPCKVPIKADRLVRDCNLAHNNQQQQKKPRNISSMFQSNHKVYLAFAVTLFDSHNFFSLSLPPHNAARNFVPDHLILTICKRAFSSYLGR